MSDFIKLTTENGTHVAVNVSQIQNIFGYHGSTLIWIDGSDGPLLVTESYDDILDTIGAVDIIGAKSAPDESDQIVCKKYPEPMYTDSEKIQILEREVRDLRKWLKLAVSDLEWVGNTNKNLDNCKEVFDPPNKDDECYRWKLHDYVEKYLNK